MRDVDDDEQEIWRLLISEFRLRFRSYFVCGSAFLALSCMLPSHLLPPIIQRIPARYISNEISASIAGLKRPNYKGQNLTESYKRLEKSLRGSGTDGRSASSSSMTISRSKPKPPQRMFHGLIVPEVPKPPEPDGL